MCVASIISGSILIHCKNKWVVSTLTRVSFDCPSKWHTTRMSNCRCVDLTHFLRVISARVIIIFQLMPFDINNNYCFDKINFNDKCIARMKIITVTENRTGVCVCPVIWVYWWWKKYKFVNALVITYLLISYPLDLTALFASVFHGSYQQVCT